MPPTDPPEIRLIPTNLSDRSRNKPYSLAEQAFNHLEILKNLSKGGNNAHADSLRLEFDKDGNQFRELGQLCASDSEVDQFYKERARYNFNPNTGVFHIRVLNPFQTHFTDKLKEYIDQEIEYNQRPMPQKNYVYEFEQTRWRTEEHAVGYFSAPTIRYAPEHVQICGLIVEVCHPMELLDVNAMAKYTLSLDTFHDTYIVTISIDDQHKDQKAAIATLWEWSEEWKMPKRTEHRFRDETGALVKSSDIKLPISLFLGDLDFYKGKTLNLSAETLFNCLK